MHGLYKGVLTFCAVFVGLILAVMGLWALVASPACVRAWCWPTCRSACPPV